MQNTNQDAQQADNLNKSERVRAPVLSITAFPKIVKAKTSVAQRRSALPDFPRPQSNHAQHMFWGPVPKGWSMQRPDHVRKCIVYGEKFHWSSAVEYYRHKDLARKILLAEKAVLGGKFTRVFYINQQGPFGVYVDDKGWHAQRLPDFMSVDGWVETGRAQTDLFAYSPVPEKSKVKAPAPKASMPPSAPDSTKVSNCRDPFFSAAKTNDDLEAFLRNVTLPSFSSVQTDRRSTEDILKEIRTIIAADSQARKAFGPSVH